MNQERLLKIIVGPVISEKAMMAAENANQHVFKVVPDATKNEIKKAVESFFGVQVANVRTVNMKGKAKRFGMIQGRRANWKKAYVTLAEGQEIDFAGGE
ncbi:MAG: 50S ribosomal protein L23 [Gammaproteobacteria bacterium]|nr:MAG: 50S ribosomal protein L23 [Gammaproteobacteria bacterium]